AVSNQKTDLDRQRIYDLNIENVKKQLDAVYESYNIHADKNIAARMFTEAIAFTDKHRIQTIQKKDFASSEQASSFIQNAIDQSKLNSKENLFSSVLKDANSLLNYSDGILDLQKELGEELGVFREELKRREGVLNKLMGDYVAVKEV